MLQKIGETWVTKLSELRRLEPISKEEALLRAVLKVKQVFKITYYYNAL